MLQKIFLTRQITITNWSELFTDFLEAHDVDEAHESQGSVWLACTQIVQQLIAACGGSLEVLAAIMRGTYLINMSIATTYASQYYAILVVERVVRFFMDADEREAFASWLEAYGYCFISAFLNPTQRALYTWVGFIDGNLRNVGISVYGKVLWNRAYEPQGFWMPGGVPNYEGRAHDYGEHRLTENDEADRRAYSIFIDLDEAQWHLLSGYASEEEAIWANDDSWYGYNEE